MTVKRWLVAVALAGLVWVVPDPTLGQPDRAHELLRVYAEILDLGHQRSGSEVAYRDLVRASIQGATRDLDPHSSFLSPAAYGGMRQRQQGTYFGVGMLVSRRDSRLVVISPIEGSPAWRVGLRAGDVISAVDGVETAGLSLDESVDRIKGPKGTEVTLAILRGDAEDPFEVTLARAEIPQETVRYAYMMDEQTGYVRLTDFSRSSGREMRDALTELRAAGMKRLILDLRNNGGGLLDAAVEVAGLFLPPGSLVVGTQGRVRNARQQFFAEGEVPWEPLPLVVLVNRGTASAAEIVSGAIQDHDLGVIVGTPTWGKGLVQTVYNLSYESGIALTTARYTTPSGRVIQRDYSDYYDYYSPEGGDPGSISGPTFSTSLGRTVHGGGGITPDVEIEPGDGLASLQRLFIWNAFFDFAVAYLDRHSITESWRPPAQLLDEFRDWLSERRDLSVQEAEELLGEEESRRAIVRQIHSDLFNAAFDTEAAHRVLARGDLQIVKAREMLTEAKELLDRRQQLVGRPFRGRPDEPGAGRSRGSQILSDSRIAATFDIPRAAQATYEFLVAVLEQQDGDLARAVEHYRRAMELAPDPYMTLALAGMHQRVLERSRDRGRQRDLQARTVELVRTARAQAPRDVMVLREYGLRMAALGERDDALLEEAQNALDRVRRERPDDVPVLMVLANVQRHQGKDAEALELLREAASRQVSFSVDVRLSEMLLESGEYQEAEDLLEDLVAERRSSVRLWLRLVEAHRRQGDARAAVDAIRSAPSEIQEEQVIRERLEEALRSLGQAPPR